MTITLPFVRLRRVWTTMRLLGIWSILIGLGAVPAQGESNHRSYDLASAKPPNIIFILADDLGWQDVGFAGARFFETPHMDQLAAGGMIFTDAYSGGPNCAPTRACLMSGTYSPRHKIYTPGGLSQGKIPYMRLLVPCKGRKSNAPLQKQAMQHVQSLKSLSPKFVCIPEILKAEGYTTARLGKWHLGRDLQGFDISDPDGLEGRGNKKGKGIDNRYGDIHVAETLTDRALRFLEDHRDRPFFLYLTHWDVHVPYNARQAVVEKYRKKLATIPKEDRANFNPTYAAMIHAVDTSVGRVVAKVQELGLEQKTLIIFSSDNGGLPFVSQLEPLRGYKGSLYEGGVRVATCMSWAGQIEPGSTCDSPITSVDFLPTFTALAQGKLPTTQPVDGVDISPLLRGQAIDERAIFWHFPLYLSWGTRHIGKQETFPKGKPPTLLGGLPSFELPNGNHYAWRGVPCSSMRRGDWKLFEFFEQNTVALYNLNSDPSERHEVAKDHPEITAQLRAELDAWQKKTKAVIPRLPNPESLLP